MTPGLIKLLNKVDAPFHVFAHMHPLYTIRVTADEEFRTFRVEHLVLTNRDIHDPRGSWRTIATLGDQTPMATYGAAMNAALRAQKERGKKALASRSRVLRP